VAVGVRGGVGESVTTLLAFSIVAAVAFVAGYALASARTARTARADLLATASRVALDAAGADGATLARIAYGKAVEQATKERRVLFPPEAWAELAPDPREAGYRVAAGAVDVVREDAAERVRRAMVEAEASRMADRAVGR